MAPRSVRPLGIFERAQLLTGASFPFNLVTAVRFTGALSEVDLEAALRRLQVDHPMLACAVRGRSRDPRFELDEGAPPIPLRTVERRASGSWREAAEAELVGAFDAGCAPLMRCVHVSAGPAPGARELLFTFHHAIVDAVAALTVLQRVLELLGSTAQASAEREPRPSLPGSLDEHLPPSQRGLRAGWRNARFLLAQMLGEVTYRWRTRGARPTVFEGPFRCRVLPVVFDPEATDGLVRASRRHRVSVWSALNAALLLALARRRYPGRAMPHRYFAFPLLRPYLEPPIPNGVVAGYFSLLRLTAEVSPATGLWELAASMHRQADAAAKRGEKYSAARWSGLSMRALLRQHSCRMGSTALSYAGAVELRACAPLTLEGLHAFVSNFPLGPEYTAQARILQRRLWLDILYLDCDMTAAEAREIVDDMRALLGGPTSQARQER